MAHMKTDMSSSASKNGKKLKSNWVLKEHVFLVIKKIIDSSSISLTLIQHNEKIKWNTVLRVF